MTRNLLDPAVLDHWLAQQPEWASTGDELTRTVGCGDFPAAIDLVVAVAADSERLDHHPDIDIRYTSVRFALRTHSAGGLTELDLELAERISRLAAARS